jgi:hypothetical protein
MSSAPDQREIRMSGVIMGDNLRMAAPSTDDRAGRYESAEAAYLDRVREGRASELTDSAIAVAEAAKAWETAAYARYFETKAKLGETSGAALHDESQRREGRTPGRAVERHRGRAAGGGPVAL